jgi:tetratricopeptide (TPR) repeat protein
MAFRFVVIGPIRVPNSWTPVGVMAHALVPQLRSWRLGVAGALASISLTIGCASARINKDRAAALAAADRHVLEGCYDCLLQARATYTQLASGKSDKGTPAIVARLFETDVLLALREKELALNWRGTVDSVRALVPRVPPALEPQRVLEVIDAVLPDRYGVARTSLAELEARHEPFRPKVAGELAWLSRAGFTPAVRSYISTVLDCSYRERTVKPIRIVVAPNGTVPVDPSPDGPPLALFATGICVDVDTALLQRVRAAVPAFAEAAYFLAQPATWEASETGGDSARALLQVAYKRFPRAPGVTYLFGALDVAIGECAEAVRYFNETIAIEPAHQWAWLQRTICLTNLHRDAAAIESATQLIALGGGTVEDGYYWRALNRRTRKELEQARSDIERAKSIVVSDSSGVFTLAGMIEHDQDDQAAAEPDLRAALALLNGPKNCPAQFYLALVMNKGERWHEAATLFETAMGCYDQKVAADRARIARLVARTNINPAFKARRIAELDADIVEQRVRYHAAAFNGANTNAMDGNVARARELVEIAAQSPDLAGRVATLREALKASR